MNFLSKDKVEAIEAALEQKCSRRATAKALGMHRSTVCRYAKLLGYAIEKRKCAVRDDEVEFFIRVSPLVWRALQLRAGYLKLSERQLTEMTLETITKDKLWRAVLDF